MFGGYGGYFGFGEEKQEEEEEFDFEDELDLDTDLDSVLRARLQERGIELPPLYPLYAKDKNKEDQISNFMQQYEVLNEFQQISTCLPCGMYLSPSPTSIFLWHGVIMPRSGFYRGGIFKFQVDLPEEYPEGPPTIVFITDIYHPMVELGTGRIDLDFWAGQSGSDLIAAVLPHLFNSIVNKDHILFKSEDKEAEALNPEARDLFKNDPEKFAEKAMESVEASKSEAALYQNPEGALLRFADGPQERHDELLAALRETDIAGVKFEDRKDMFVEWFCDYYVRYQVLGKGKKKKKKRSIAEAKMRDARRPTGKDFKKYKEMMEKEDVDSDEDDIEESV